MKIRFFSFYLIPVWPSMPVKASPGCELQELWIRVAIRRGAEGLRHIGCGISLLWYHVYYSHVSMGKPFQSGAKLPLLWWWKWYLFLMGQSWGDIFPPAEILFQPFSLLSAPSSPCVTPGPSCFALFGSLQVSGNDSGSMISVSPGAGPSSCLLFCCLH